MTQALTQCQCDSPSTLTEQVDKKGEALVASHDVNMCSGVCRTLRSVGLLVSTCRAGRVESIIVVTDIIVGHILLLAL